jgi:IclR family acetate operon transcriptional repressor
MVSATKGGIVRDEPGHDRVVAGLQPGQPMSSVQSLTRAFQVLGCVSESDGTATYTQIASETGLNRTTVWRLANALAAFGMLRIGPDGTLCLGPRLIVLGELAAHQNLLSPRSHAVLSDLVNQTGETCHLALPEGDGLVYVDKVESKHTIRVASRIGARLSLHCTSLGKAYLAHLAPTTQKWLLGQLTLTARTARTITDASQLAKELESIARRGWALDDEENEPGIRCIAAPILGGDNRAIGAVSATFPLQRLARKNPAALEEQARRVVAAARALSPLSGPEGQASGGAHGASARRVP